MAERKQGTFLVTGVDDASAVVRDVYDGQVHTLSDPPELAVEDVLEATLEPEPPMEVTWTVVELDARRTIPVERSTERPTKQARDIAADQQVGDLTRQERAGDGELHVISVAEDETDQAVTDLLDDETTLVQAARLGVDRVEVRAAEGVVSVRYLP